MHRCEMRACDVFRGLALLMIFIDHIPGNVLSLIAKISRNFGFSDAAEIFVLLAAFIPPC